MTQLKISQDRIERSCGDDASCLPYDDQTLIDVNQDGQADLVSDPVQVLVLDERFKADADALAAGRAVIAISKQDRAPYDAEFRKGHIYHDVVSGAMSRAFESGEFELQERFLPEKPSTSLLRVAYYTEPSYELAFKYNGQTFYALLNGESFSSQYIDGHCSFVFRGDYPEVQAELGKCLETESKAQPVTADGFNYLALSEILVTNDRGISVSIRDTAVFQTIRNALATKTPQLAAIKKHLEYGGYLRDLTEAPE